MPLPQDSICHDAVQTKAILFDFDGVLTTDRTGTLTTLRYLHEQTGVGYERLHDVFRKFNADLNLGRTTHGEIWPDLCRALNCQIDIALLRLAFESTPLNHSMMYLARQLKQKYFVGIITDNKKDRMDHLRSYARLTEVFEPIVVSAEVGSGKESPLIFKRALDYLGVTPSESVFIDNSPGNLIAPRALGMNAIYFDDATGDVPRLVATLQREHGVSVAGAAWL